MDVLIPGTHLEIVRDPDTALRPLYSAGGDKPSEPRLIVEIDVNGRGIIETQRYCREYVDLVPMLRAVLLVNLSYRKNYKFACLMTLYRRGVDGGAVVKGVVNLGGVSMSPGSARQVEWSRPHQKLPLVPLHGRTEDPESQWGADNRSFVEVPAADILYQALPDPTTPTEARENLYIDVWRMYRDIS